MIAKMGYPAETHEVITEYGYILQMHRIPFGKKSPLVEGVEKPVVLLQHGLLCSSADYVMGIPEKSLGELTYPIVHEQGNKTIGKLDCKEQIATPDQPRATPYGRTTAHHGANPRLFRARFATVVWP
jgi:hypothetical protein